MKKKRLKDYMKLIHDDIIYRTYVMSAFSFFITLAFCGYNLFLGIIYKTAWNTAIASYYFLLIFIRAFVGICELKWKKSSKSEDTLTEKRKHLFLVQSVLLLIIDIALIAPISLMVMQKKQVNYSLIPAIAMAAYTVYKITTAISGYVKTKKIQHLSITALKSLNFIDALVSILSLQYTLIMAIDGGVNGDMLTLCCCTSFAIWIFIIAFTIKTLMKAIKICKNKISNQDNNVNDNKMSL